MRREEARERKRGWNRVILSRKRSGQGVVVGRNNSGRGGERRREMGEKKNEKNVSP